MKTSLIDRKHLFFLLLAGIFLISSCQKNNEISKQNYHQFNFTQQEITDVGVLHNQYLTQALKDFDYSSENLYADLKSNFHNIAPQVGGFTTEQLIELGEKFDIKDHRSYFLNPNTSIMLYEELIHLCENEKQNFASFMDELDRFSQKVEGNLIGNDKMTFQILISVAENSSRLWYPKNKGGEGLFDHLYESINGKDAAKPRRLQNVAASDVAGVTGAVIRITGVCLWNPACYTGVSTAAILGGIAFSGAWSSGAAGVLSCIP
jgi:hypothetical protein